MTGILMTEWQYVNSSNVETIRYCRETSELYVRFHGGRDYVYFDVQENVVAELIKAPSVGTYLAQYIKGRYRYERL